jgi:antitoxin ParD1/3/4
MSNVERLTITLTADMAQAVRGGVDSGAYASASEVIREALRDWRHKRQMQARQLAELQADVRAGLDDIAAGRMSDFDAEEIIQHGRARSAERSPSR